MNFQSLKLVPYGCILFDVRLQLLYFFFFKRELLFLYDYLIDFIVLFESHQQLEYNSSCDQFKQSFEDMNQSYLSTDFNHIIFAVIGQESNNFHCCFCHIEEHIIRFAISYNWDSKESLLYLLEFFVGWSHTEIRDLLECIWSVRLVGIASN